MYKYIASELLRTMQVYNVIFASDSSTLIGLLTPILPVTKEDTLVAFPREDVLRRNLCVIFVIMAHSPPYNTSQHRL